MNTHWEPLTPVFMLYSSTNALSHGVAGCDHPPLDIVTEVHGDEQLVGQQGGFPTGRPGYQTQRHHEGGQLLDEPGQAHMDRTAVPAAGVAAVRHVFKEQREEGAAGREEHHVSHKVQSPQLSLLRGEEGGQQRVHHGGGDKLTGTYLQQQQCDNVQYHQRTPSCAIAWSPYIILPPE